ncbi:MAG TPA: histidine kinase [Bacteroidota bacterium]|nr:histidine kinase [Bacteroidota bacterium]
MHPILKDRRTLALYLFAWLAPGLTLATLLATTAKASWTGAICFSLPATTVFAFMSLSSWYVCRAFPLPESDIAKTLLSILSAALLSSGLWLIACYAWASALEWMAPGLAPGERYSATLPILLSFGTGLFLIAAAVHYLIESLEGSRRTERNALELQVLARDAELKALRAQIDPHFLFNSLNSISALTSADPGAARTMTLMLADFLRMSMTYGALDMISLDEELTLVRHFLEIEKIRFGSRLVIATEVAAETLPARVPPLLLQPLVENAVNHGIASLPGGGVLLLRAGMHGSCLRLLVQNPVDPERGRGRGAGMGLHIVRQRLQRIYGADGRLAVRETEEVFAVDLTIPQNTPYA